MFTGGPSQVLRRRQVRLGRKAEMMDEDLEQWPDAGQATGCDSQAAFDGGPDGDVDCSNCFELSVRRTRPR